MLLRYPGNGNSIPSLRTVATSVPLPPVGPPPAFGALLGFSFAFASVRAAAGVFGAALLSVGVAALGAFDAGVLVRVVGGALAVLAFGTGVSRIVDGFVAGGVTAAGDFVAPAFTSPIARSPGGAATIFTRYIGGSATGFPCLRLLNRRVATRACSTAEAVIGANRPDPSLRDITQPLSRSSALRRLGDESDVSDATCPHQRQHLYHCAVRHAVVGAKVHSPAAPSLRQRLEAR